MEHLFRQQITFASIVGRTSTGAPIYGSQSTAPARVEPSNKMIKDSRGIEHLATAVIYLRANVTLSERVWLPGMNPADPNMGRRPIRVDEYVDGWGAYRYRAVWL